MTPSVDPDVWRRLADRARDAIWLVDAQMRLVLLNVAAERLAGVRASEVVGTDLRSSFPTFAGSEGEAAVRRVLQGSPREVLRRRHPRLGTWVDIEVQPDPLGAVVVVRDVERLVELERRRQLETAILDSVGEGIYGVDASNRVTFMNAAAERLLGRTAASVAGQDSHQAFHHTRPDGSPYPAQECPLLATLEDGEPRDATDMLWRADGTPLHVEYHSTAIREDGAITGAVVSFRDLSDKLAANAARVAAETATDALHELQQVLQPPPPNTDDPRLGISYLPADAAGAGGDLYDWQALPGDGMHLAVVDVVGKGLPAARDALAVTHALRLLVLADTSLTRVVEQASWLLGEAYPDLAATAIVARYRRSTGRLQFVSAGHPPPLLLRPDGTHDYLEASGRPIGWPDAGTDDIAELEVPPGGRVIFYTDGLVEAHRDVVAGMTALAALADSARALDASAAARHLVTETLAAAERRDDCLALVLDRPAPASD